MKTYLLSLTVVVLCSCVSYSGPNNQAPITTTTELQKITGLYNNAGDPGGLLSIIIWGNNPINLIKNKSSLDHYDIKFLKVTSNKNFILVSAITSSCIAYEKRYELGIDFEIDEGKIVLFSNIDLLTRGAGDPLVGPSITETALALDVNGNVAYKQQAHAAGLIYLLVPAVISDTTEIRFTKSKTFKTYPQCKSR